MKNQNLRGFLTSEIKEKAEKYLNREFTQTELRLYPYIQYCCMNGGYIGREKTSEKERVILQQLVNEKHLIRDYPADFYPTKDFWMFMNDILTDAYVVTAEELEETDE